MIQLHAQRSCSFVSHSTHPSNHPPNLTRQYALPIRLLPRSCFCWRWSAEADGQHHLERLCAFRDGWVGSGAPTIMPIGPLCRLFCPVCVCSACRFDAIRALIAQDCDNRRVDGWWISLHGHLKTLYPKHSPKYQADPVSTVADLYP